MAKKQAGWIGGTRIVVICLILLLSTAGLNATEAAEPDDSVNLKQIDATVARLSDEQVRRLLLQELQKAASAAVSEDSGSSGLLSRYEAFCILANKRIKAVFSKAYTLPADFAIGVQQMSSRQGKTYSQMFFTAIFGLTRLLIGFGVEKLCLNRGSGLIRHIETATTEHGLGRVPRGFVLLVPNLLGLLSSNIDCTTGSPTNFRHFRSL